MITPKKSTAIKKGKILEHPAAKMELTTKLKVESETPIILNVDGELYENIPFEVKIIKNTLKMYR